MTLLIRKKLAGLLSALLLWPIAALCSPDLTDMRAIHMGGNWGVTIRQDWENEGLPEEYIDWLKSVNANWVGVSVAIHVLDSLDSTVKPRYSDDPQAPFTPTFTDAQLTTLIQLLRENGFHVYLTLSFELELHGVENYVDRGALGVPTAYDWGPEYKKENWPWDTEHPDHETFVAEFWQSFTDVAVHFAALSESLGVEMYSLGTETEGLFRTRAGDGWPNHFKDELVEMVSGVRAVFSGLVTYDLHFNAVGAGKSEYGAGTDWLWRDLGLDVVGISAYFPLTDTEPTSKLSYAQLKTAYEQVFTDYLQPLQTLNPGIPIVFTEYGRTDSIRSPLISNTDEGEIRVFTDTDSNGLDDGDETQANIYKAFFETNKEYGNIVLGAFLWGHDWASYEQWENQWGSIRMISIRDKLAEELVRSEYGASLTGTIVDKSDGVTPVHPVTIGLLNVNEDNLVDFSTVNNADGSYAFTGLPPGDYKVYSDAFDTAEEYSDELHDGIFCDQLSCDPQTQGTVITIHRGENEFHEQLVRLVTLSGMAVDQIDGVTPVNPVIVSLIDPITGEDPPGLSARTDDQGLYEITNIPAGNYKVIFNAVEGASHYRDELYNQVSCTEGTCDMASLGSIVNIGAGENILNVALVAGNQISGTVTNESDDPLTGILVEVLDVAGERFRLSPTNNSGYWSQPVSANGTYYARTNIRGYVPEVWANKSCVNCDPTLKGTPIVVSNADQSGIDFKLMPTPSNFCKSGDLIALTGFEDLIGNQIMFTSTTNVVFTELEQQAVFTVTFQDNKGQDLDPVSLEWCLSDDTVLEIMTNGVNATVTATGMSGESVDLIVRDPPSSAQAIATIEFSDLN